MGQRNISNGKRGTTYNCPYYKVVRTGNEPDVIAKEKRNGGKWYYCECECGLIHLPYECYLAYRERYCANEDVNGWRDCSLARAMNDYWEKR